MYLDLSSFELSAPPFSQLFFSFFLLFLVILNFSVSHVCFHESIDVSSLLPSSCPFPSIFFLIFFVLFVRLHLLFFWLSFFFPISIHCLFSFSFSAVYCFVFVHVVPLILCENFYATSHASSSTPSHRSGSF